MATRTATKAPYHHGHLETALVDAAIVLVRKYGPDHLSLRAVSAEIGVSPSASYHHFRDKDALVSAISIVLFDRLAIMQEKAIAKIKGKGAPGAIRKFEVMGKAYFAWATSEPNLYRLMFGGYCEVNVKEHGSKAWNLLRDGLDELASEGVLSKDARPGGEKIVWSTVHGASSLAIEGWMSPSDFPMVWKSIQRSLGITPKD
jgi:AcrR family transcriptional regulator